MSLPIPKLDDKSFQELFEEARALVPRFAPEWTDHNYSDPGITFIDLFAWLAEMQLYNLDRVTDRHILKFLKLLGTEPAAAASARVDVTFTLSRLDNDYIKIPPKTKVSALDKISGQEYVFETEAELLVTPTAIDRVFTRDGSQWIDHLDYNAVEGVFYFAFAENPLPGNQLYLCLSPESRFPQDSLKLTITMYEADLPEPGSFIPGEIAEIIPSAEIAWEYWDGSSWQTTPAEDESGALGRNGSIQFSGLAGIALIHPADYAGDEFPPYADQCYLIRATLKSGSYEIPPRIDTIAVNTVAATHGETFSKEYFSATGLPFQTVELAHKPVLKNTLILNVAESDDDFQPWAEAADFDNSGPEDLHYILNLENGLVTFGDGINGRVPPSGKNNIQVAEYRSGGGETGNAKADTIQKIIYPANLPAKVNNPKPAAGGAEAETLEAAQQRARRELKKRFRTITSNDFETLAFSTPGLRIVRVKVLPLYHPQYCTVQIPGAVTVVVVPQVIPGSGNTRPTPGEGFLKTVENHLDEKRIATTNLHVIGPSYTAISVTATVTIKPRTSPEIVRMGIESALNDFLHPLSGGPEENGWPFGRQVHKSEILQVIQGVDGVACVESAALSSEKIKNANTIKIPRIGLVCPGKHNIKVIS